jgi:hypothetical protein
MNRIKNKKKYWLIINKCSGNELEIIEKWCFKNYKLDSAIGEYKTKKEAYAALIDFTLLFREIDELEQRFNLDGKNLYSTHPFGAMTIAVTIAVIALVSAIIIALIIISILV